MKTPSLFLRLGLLALLAGVLQAEPAADDRAYVPPAGAAAPIAPPLQKGSPLDHLANDPKLESLPPGMKEGNTSGEVYFVAHRFVDPVGGLGWGWLRKSDGDWNSAQWIALQESPGRAAAPSRKLAKLDGDVNYEYKFWGTFAGYQAYDPRVDEMLPVFLLQGYEVLGPADPLKNRTGPPDRRVHRASGASSRSSNPILSDPDVD